PGGDAPREGPRVAALSATPDPTVGDVQPPSIGERRRDGAPLSAGIPVPVGPRVPLPRSEPAGRRPRGIGPSAEGAESPRPLLGRALRRRDVHARARRPGADGAMAPEPALRRRLA